MEKKFHERKKNNEKLFHFKIINSFLPISKRPLISQKVCEFTRNDPLLDRIILF